MAHHWASPRPRSGPFFPLAPPLILACASPRIRLAAAFAPPHLTPTPISSRRRRACPRPKSPQSRRRSLPSSASRDGLAAAISPSQPRRSYAIPPPPPPLAAPRTARPRLGWQLDASASRPFLCPRQVRPLPPPRCLALDAAAAHASCSASYAGLAATPSSLSSPHIAGAHRLGGANGLVACFARAPVSGSLEAPPPLPPPRRHANALALW